MIDLIVIGAGLAGLTAALTAAEAGLRVKVVSKGLNALHWSAATLDLFGYTPPRATPILAPWATLPTAAAAPWVNEASPVAPAP